jgi:hypothetical protein
VLNPAARSVSRHRKSSAYGMRTVKHAVSNGVMNTIVAHTTRKSSSDATHHFPPTQKKKAGNTRSEIRSQQLQPTLSA